MIAAGDQVGYSASFLRSIHAFTGELPRARGVVTRIKRYSEKLSVAAVDWGTSCSEAAAKVNVKNLAKVGTPAMNTQ